MDQHELVRRPHLDAYGIRERWDARPEVVGHPLHERGNVYLITPWRAPNALEPVRDSIEADEVGAHVGDGGVRPFVGCAIFQQLDPAAEARERCSELVRRLARHARPDALPLGIAAGAHDVDAGEQQDERGGGLQGRNDAEPFHQRRVAIVDAPDQRIHHWWVLPVEVADVGSHRGVVARHVRRQVGVRGRRARAVGDDQRHALLADAIRQLEERLRSGALAGIALRAKDARVHPAGAKRFDPEIAYDATSVDDVGREKNGEQ